MIVPYTNSQISDEYFDRQLVISPIAIPYVSARLRNLTNLGHYRPISGTPKNHRADTAQIRFESARSGPIRDTFDGERNLCQKTSSRTF